MATKGKAPAPQRRHGLRPNRRQAVRVLFASGMDPRPIGRLLGLTYDETLNALRHPVAKRARA